ncbi:TPA: hypothetical protein ACMEWK_001158 [Klebsiella variicola subsp. variicola]|uniref:hypothetical protein n=1 Tax=Klebsiella variicola TaxID=244366 RepID=UPI0025502800|nr:hypothetical protein [Klebsiella variicola]MEC5671395.1 hypothetical protein [Klebsiella variicola]
MKTFEASGHDGGGFHEDFCLAFIAEINLKMPPHYFTCPPWMRKLTMLAQTGYSAHKE